MPNSTCHPWHRSLYLGREEHNESGSVGAHIEAYLNLRRSLGFQTAPEAGNLRELSDYRETQGFSRPIRTQTILDWISAAALHCGLPGQRMLLHTA